MDDTLPPMVSLRGLRLNCLLVPLVVVTVAAIALTWHHLIMTAHAQRLRADGLRDILVAYAGLETLGVRPALAEALKADPRWRGLAEWRMAGERVEIAHSAGEIGLRSGDPPPELVLAVQEPQTWRAPRGDLAVAVALRDRQGQTAGVLYGQARFSDEGWWAPYVWSLTALLGVGGGLGWYLIARVYRPVEYLTRAAQAAVERRPPPPEPGIVTFETQELRSSVMQLADLYRAQATPPDAKP